MKDTISYISEQNVHEVQLSPGHMIWVQEALEIRASDTLGRQEANPVLWQQGPDPGGDMRHMISQTMYIGRSMARFVSLKTLFANHILPSQLRFIWYMGRKGNSFAHGFMLHDNWTWELVCGLNVFVFAEQYPIYGFPQKHYDKSNETSSRYIHLNFIFHYISYIR